jgi:MraZ protein
MAGLEKEVVIIGVGDHCEVWDKERWRAFQEKKAAEYKDMASRLFGEEAAPGEAAPDAERVG